jgi:hypothetical protein
MLFHQRDSSERRRRRGSPSRGFQLLSLAARSSPSRDSSRCPHSCCCRMDLSPLLLYVHLLLCMRCISIPLLSMQQLSHATHQERRGERSHGMAAQGDCRVPASSARLGAPLVWRRLLHEGTVHAPSSQSSSGSSPLSSCLRCLQIAGASPVPSASLVSEAFPTSAYRPLPCDAPHPSTP